IPVSAISLPLDVPSASDTIPLHLRRAVRKRDKHCRFPGCDMPAAGCEVHHIIPRKDGGPHSLTNLILLCRFHHLIAIHVRREALLIRAEVKDLRRRPCRSRAA
ncbi:MAG TPA: HNH endonuclease signature motif containing protein, partial [Streptosporangiaceae bacterium]|nr:HNH endonuclease signature motif containing protein [Streptosporangiaceae bacterium]